MQFLTIREASATLDIPPSTIHRWITTGRIPEAFRFGYLWIIPADVVSKLERPPLGRPPGQGGASDLANKSTRDKDATSLEEQSS